LIIENQVRYLLDRTVTLTIWLDRLL
jgi:hypothetical protein